MPSISLLPTTNDVNLGLYKTLIVVYQRRLYELRKCSLQRSSTQHAAWAMNF